LSVLRIIKEKEEILKNKKNKKVKKEKQKIIN
jgi:hypothetical protein